MKDFADIDNSSGAFPDVVAVDCSGPGETDGFALVADYFTDIMGAFQALLNEISETPSGSAESGSGTSQILNAIKMLPTTHAVSLLSGKPRGAEWVYTFNGTPDHYWLGSTNNGVLLFPIKLPAVAMDISITITVTPGAVRAGANRMWAQLLYQDTDEVLTPIGSAVYDDGTANEQDIVYTVSGYTPTESRDYILFVAAGNTAGAANDLLLKVVVEKSAA